MSQPMDALTKDMAKGVSKIVKNPAILETFSTTELAQLHNKFSDYSPASIVAQENRSHALAAIEARMPQSESLEELGEKVKNRSRVLRCNVRQYGFRRKIASNLVLGDQSLMEEDKRFDPKMLHIAQDIIDLKHPTVKRLFYARNSFIGWLKSISVPDMLPNGLYLINRHRDEEVEERINKFELLRSEILDQMEEIWPALKEDAKKRRGPAYSESDYPDFAIIRSRYVVDWRFVDWGVPADLKQKNLNAYNRQVEKDKAEWAKTAQEVRDALRIQMQDLVAHFADRLGLDELTGKPKVFHKTAVEKINNFLKSFEDLNLTDDEELGKLVEKCRQLMHGVDPVSIRQNEGLRDTLKRGFEALKAETDTLIVVRTRKMRLEEEGSEEE